MLTEDAHTAVGMQANEGAATYVAAPKRRRAFVVVEGAALLAALLAPFALSDYLVVYATRVLILCLFALSFDLVWGYAGLLSFGQALFFGGASYVTALLARDLGVTSILIILPIGALVGLISATLLGALLLLGRNPTSVIFVALGTLTGSFAAERLASGWYYVGGNNGIPALPSLSLGRWQLDEGPAFYAISLTMLVAIYLLCRSLVRSQFGLILAGLRLDEQRIKFFGYDVPRLKLLVFALSGAIAGLSGSLFTFHEGFIGPNILGIVFSTQVVLYVLVGGSGALLGAVLGTVLIEALSFWLSDTFHEIWPIILGLLLLLVTLFRPGGLISLFLSDEERTGIFGRAPNRIRHDSLRRP
jgi:branched-chain amino acid transport system permease protein